MIGTKICTICKKEKPLSMFTDRKMPDGRISKYSACRECYNLMRKKYYYDHHKSELEKRKEWHLRNQEYANGVRRERYRKNKKMILAKNAEYRKTDEYKKWRTEYEAENHDKLTDMRREYQRNNKDKVSEWHKKYRLTHAEQLKAYNAEYRKKNRSAIAKKALDRLHNDPKHKLKEQLRNCIRDSFRRGGIVKKNLTTNITGMKTDELYEYLKKTWLDRYGYEWNGEPCHIDHIVPLATAKSEEDIRKLCHYTNLQLLTPEDNMKKSAKV